jgi:hypothetical protein
MKFFNFSICVFFSIILSACINIHDEVILNSDGSGSFKYGINLSAVKSKINSYLALDSLDGKKVPSIDEIKQAVLNFKNIFSQKDGISNFSFEEDYSNYIFKLSCDFKNLDFLQNALKEAISEIINQKEPEIYEHQWITFSNNILIRSIPSSIIEQLQKIRKEDIDLLKDGKYTSITRFDKEIENFDNKNAILNKTKNAVMIQVNTFSLLNDTELLNIKVNVKE